MVCRRERFDNGRDMSESGSREAAATRSQGVVHLHLRSHEDAARLLAGVLGRAREGTEPAVLVVTPSPEDALRLAEVRAARRAALGDEEAGHLLTPITSSVRGRRQLTANPAAVAGAPAELLQLLVESRLRLGGLRAVVLVWPEELLADERARELEALLAEAPKAADRVAIVSRPSETLDEVLERVMWRARRIDHRPPEQADAIRLRFIAVGPQQRVPELRALLDSIDPEGAAIVALTDPAEVAAQAALGALGFEENGPFLSVLRGVPETPLELAIVLETPTSDQLTALAQAARDVIAIVEPTQVALLRTNSGGGAEPFPVGGPLAAAHTELESVRERVRAVVSAQGHLPWLPVIEPLLTDLDPVEVAAGALALMPRSRRPARDEKAAEPTASREARGRRPAGDASAMTRLFIGIGERDGVRRNDLVGAITGEAGITGSQIGKVALRDSHAVVEVDSAVAAQVIRKLGGTSLRGRKLIVREDREPAGGERGGSARPAARRGPPRGGRGARPETGDRPRRGREPDENPRLPRAARESEEWASRGDRLRNSRRGPRRDRE
jgi:ATP-dependent RNA helicase DeaD